MNEDPILSLLRDLYMNGAALRAENEALKQQLARVKQDATSETPTAT